MLAGQYEHAGTLGELVIKADQASVAQELGGDPSKALAAPKHALQRKLLDGLRCLLKAELKLNQPQASDGWLTEDALWLVSKTVSDKLRAHLLSQGIDGIPASNTAVFNVLQDHGIALPTPDGKAIWKATVTSDAGWSHSFTFLKVSPALIWDASNRPAAFTGAVRVERGTVSAEAEGIAAAPADADAMHAMVVETSARASSSNTPSAAAAPIAELLDLFDARSGSTDSMKHSGTSDADMSEERKGDEGFIAAPADLTAGESAGEKFMDWLRVGVQSRRIIINDAKALVHTVADAVYLVSPGIFQRYAQEHLEIAIFAKKDGVADWQWIQKRFERLQIHRKQASGLNIWTCQVVGPRKSRRIHGYLLSDGCGFFASMPTNNPYLKVCDG